MNRLYHMRITSDDYHRIKTTGMQEVPVRILIALLHGYRWLVSPLLGNVCRFHPTCSQYAVEAIERHGALRGFWLALRRVGRCHPLASGRLRPGAVTETRIDSLWIIHVCSFMSPLVSSCS